MKRMKVLVCANLARSSSCDYETYLQSLLLDFLRFSWIYFCLLEVLPSPRRHCGNLLLIKVFQVEVRGAEPPVSMVTLREESEFLDVYFSFLLQRQQTG